MPSFENLLETGRQYHMAGRLADAEAAYRRILESEPSNAEANFLLGTLAYQVDEYQQAEQLLQNAIRGNPRRSDYYNNLGLVLRARGEPERAVRAFEEAARLAPDSPAVLNNLGMVESELGHLDRAERLIRQALDRQPDYIDAWNNLGGVLLDKGKAAEAIRCYREVVRLAPEHPLAHLNLGIASQANGEPDAAFDAYGRAASLAPDAVEPHLNTGILFKELGRFDEAIKAFGRVLERQPDNVEALYSLSDCRKAGAVDQNVERMKRLFDDGAVQLPQKILLGFGLGKIFDDLKDYDTAFGYYDAANRLKRQTLDYEVEADVRAFDKIIETFDAEFFRKRVDYGIEDRTPIFVLGMPRSGTSLTEQILSSHPDVYGAGELLSLPRVCFSGDRLVDIRFVDNACALTAAESRAMAENYVDELKALRTGEAFVTDKLPENFIYIGMIKLLLPNARIIHCQRDGMDTCLSNFKNNFDVAAYYAYDLTELGTYYRAYERLMAHWNTVLPGFVFNLQYEDLVAEPETNIREMLDYCGLEFDEKCLNFHENKRTVKTASEFQVRQPMYATSVQSWSGYNRHLGPLREALGRR